MAENHDCAEAAALPVVATKQKVDAIDGSPEYEVNENAALVDAPSNTNTATSAIVNSTVVSTDSIMEGTDDLSPGPCTPNSDTSGDSCFLGDIFPSQSHDSSFVAPAASDSFDNREIASALSIISTTQRGRAEAQDVRRDVSSCSDHLDLRPPRHSFNRLNRSIDGVQMMYDPILTFPPPYENQTRTVSPSARSWNGGDRLSSSIQLDENWSTVGGTASVAPSDGGGSHASTSKIDGKPSGELRCSPDKSILDSCFLDDDEQSVKSSDKEGARDYEADAKPYSHVSAAHEILNSFISMNSSLERQNDLNSPPSTLGGSKASYSQIEDRVDKDTRKSPVSHVATSPRDQASSSSPRSQDRPSYTLKSPMSSPPVPPISNENNAAEAGINKTPLRRNSLPNNDSSSPTKSYDKKKLNVRLRQRLAERNQRIRMSNTAEKGSPEKEKLGVNVQARLMQNAHKRPVSCSSDSGYGRQTSLGSSNRSERVSGTFMKYGIISPTGVFPETATFDSEDNDSSPLLHRNFRKSTSETGVPSTTGISTTRPPIQRQMPPPHGIGILQPDGVVFDDALLLRLARQARYSRLRGEIPTVDGERRYNSVKIHVYDLLQRDALVEMPYFNCNFPIGQCFKVMNNAANCLGTGAYHVGVEVNGIEYAFGANNIMGMSGVFTCTPKHSPGYEYRETLDFGNVRTTKNTWIRIPKENALGQTICRALGSSRDAMDAAELDMLNTSTVSTAEYTFRQIESFADGNAVIHSMAREYMGSDYDLLRKNCCTFARDVCLRLGVKDEDIPRWFHNAAKAGADAEDAITSAEKTVKNMFDCADMEGDPIDLMEGFNHGFEVIADLKRGSSKLKVVESPPVYRHASARQPLLDCEDQSEYWETLSWTY